MIDLLQSVTIAGLTVAVVLQVLSSRNHHERIKMLEAEIQRRRGQDRRAAGASVSARALARRRT